MERLEQAGAQVPLIDLTRNGDGPEWSEAAARIVSPVSLRSAPIGVVRGEAWVRRWCDLAAKLRNESKTVARSDRAMLADLAMRADATADGLRPCTGPARSRFAQADVASGSLPELPAGRLDGRASGAEVFSASQCPCRHRIRKEPLIVLVDGETWSAAEQFAALLQDNDATVAMGTRTGGAGRGHLTWRGADRAHRQRSCAGVPPTARFRGDGGGEVSGIVPHVPTGAPWSDGSAYAGRLTAARLPEAISQAKAMFARQVRQGGTRALLTT